MWSLSYRFFSKMFNRGAMGERAIHKLPIPTGSKKICAFSEDEKTLVVVTTDGRYYTFSVSNG